MWLDNGVWVSEEPIKKNKDLDVEYHGLLKNSGADSVLIHVGYDGWKNTSDVWMNRRTDGNLSVNLKAEGASQVNFCFKDTAGNWDNNDGQNWIVPIA